VNGISSLLLIYSESNGIAWEISRLIRRPIGRGRYIGKEDLGWFVEV